MNYQDTVNWMFQQLPMYQNQGVSAYKKDLSNTVLLSKYLNHPENNFRCIHVAGTNGKGSTSHMLASILQEAGYKVGLYTSPHLKDYRERIKINGKEVDQSFVVNFIEKHKPFFESNSLSFFEMTVGLAFDYFSKEKVDIAIVEVGLGGRLDSTNIITPEVSVITNIGLDHTQFLGTTIEAIAIEKGGIIKPGISVVIGETQPETKVVFETISKRMNATMYFADQIIQKKYKSDLIGSYQQINIKTAVQTIKVLDPQRFEVKERHIESGLQNVVNNTGLKGRWQVLHENPKIICDTAHNKEGLKHVVTQLFSEKHENLHVVFGVVNDKNLASIIPLLPRNAKYYFCKPNIERGLNANALKEKFELFGLHGEAFESVNDALDNAKDNALSNDLIYIGGSTFVVAEII
ncbi:tetrahydrofolate synthase [Flavobacteriales bacterium 34_180_T64]|nr:tetrahydrofolate synthase [Flavobacteriales bacterium 34_180_T64]